MSIHQFLFSRHLEEDEVVLYALHKHLSAVAGAVLKIGFFGFLIPWFLYFFLLKTSLGLWMASIWFVLALFKLFVTLISWWSDVVLVTDQCIIVIEWVSFFNHGVTRLDYKEIEGVAYRINGLLPMILGYGELTIKVSSGNNFMIYPARKPKEAEMEIAKHQQDFLSGKEHQDTEKLKDLLSSMVAKHFGQR